MKRHHPARVIPHRRAFRPRIIREFNPPHLAIVYMCQFRRVWLSLQQVTLHRLLQYKPSDHPVTLP